jgi:hypothetical protein
MGRSEVSVCCDGEEEGCEDKVWGDKKIKMQTIEIDRDWAYLIFLCSSGDVKLT